MQKIVFFFHSKAVFKTVQSLQKQVHSLEAHLKTNRATLQKQFWGSAKIYLGLYSLLQPTFRVLKKQQCFRKYISRRHVRRKRQHKLLQPNNAM